MILDKIENEIIAKLKPLKLFNGFQIEPYPIEFKKFAFTSAKGCILVKYNGSDYTKPQTLNVVTQDETLEYAVFLGLRYLKNYRDAYPYLEEIKKNLTGMKIYGKKLYPHTREFVERINGDVFWGYVFRITLPTQEVIDNDDDKNIIPLWS